MSIWEKVRLLWKVKDPAEALIEEAKGFKSGYKTWPFWATIAGSLVSVAGALEGVVPPQVSLIATTVLAGLYNFVRGAAKAEQDGVRPVLQSTEFWIGLLTMVGNVLTGLQTGGVNPAWMASTQSALATIMAFSQNLGAQNTKQS